jgi:hypothetical protein
VRPHSCVLVFGGFVHKAITPTAVLQPDRDPTTA